MVGARQAPHQGRLLCRPRRRPHATRRRSAATEGTPLGPSIRCESAPRRARGDVHLDPGVGGLRGAGRTGGGSERQGRGLRNRPAQDRTAAPGGGNRGRVGDGPRRKPRAERRASRVHRPLPRGTRLLLGCGPDDDRGEAPIPGRCDDGHPLGCAHGVLGGRASLPRTRLRGRVSRATATSDGWDHR